jgi:hypothetical protein
LAYVKSLAFCFLCSDNEDPKRDAATAPSAETMAADEPSVQEVEPVVKSPKAPNASKAPVKKVVATRDSKHLKRSTDAGASLEIHQSTRSSDDVRVDPGIFAFAPCVIFMLTCFLWTDLDEEIYHFGH